MLKKTDDNLIVMRKNNKMFLKTNSCTVYYKQLMMANVMFCCCNSSKALKPQTLHFLYNHQSIIGDRFRRLLLLLFHHNKCSKLIKRKHRNVPTIVFLHPLNGFCETLRRRWTALWLVGLETRKKWIAACDWSETDRSLHCLCALLSC